MRRHKLALTIFTVFVAVALACSRQAATPTSPSVAAPAAADAAADGSTLKATAPVPTSPINGVQVSDAQPTLTWSPSTTKVAAGGLQYEFEVFNDANAKVSGGVVGGTSVTVPTALDFGKRHTWHVRATMQGANGPWSTLAQFVSAVGAYLQGNEVRDPLTNGFTVGNAQGVTFLPGQGARLEARNSYIEYVLQTPLTDGEWSAEMTNVGNGPSDLNEAGKTKVFSMLQGDGVNVSDNAYRVTLDKRPAVNQSAFRFTMRSRGRDAGEPNAGPQSWNRANVYLFKFEWRGGRADASVFDGGVNGFLKARAGTNYSTPYSPNPHIVRIGSVGGRAGSETLPGVIVRNVWVSANPRPAF
jgi:hypothetical protein